MAKNPKLRRSMSLTIVLFFFILLFSYADQNLLGPFLNPHLQTFFGSTEDALVPKMSIISSVFVFLSGVSMVVCAILADKTSRKWICFGGTMIYALFSISTVLIPDGEVGYVLFFITRALNGIGIGAIVPTIFSMVGDTAQPEKRTAAFAYINVAMIMGQLVGMLLGGMMGDIWRIAYLITGTFSLLLAFGLLGIKEPKRGAAEKELRGIEGAEYNFSLTKEDFKKIWSNKSNFWLITNFIDCIPSGIAFFLIFKYLEDTRNMDPEMITMVVLIAFIFGIGGALVFGFLGDRLFKKDRRAKVLIALICNAFPILFFIIFLLSDYNLPDGASMGDALSIPAFVLAVGSLILLMFVNQGVGPNWHSTLTDVNLPEHRATMISLASFMDLIGHTVGPLIAGFMTAQFGLQAAMWAAVFFWGLNVVLWLPIFFYIEKDLDNIHSVLEGRAKMMMEKKENE
ncbi:MFS transporter [Candidatus Lokiarchaeum ossiferum]|uniref:MFS transporter n=1 Tax=Candidatus Lokiarchaeum ossiferum TaxID=2951803 RepID=UPI00352D062C